jgi:peptidoglycan/xylan/chitin deacetylase (PgdA/CDA1 family)
MILVLTYHKVLHDQVPDSEFYTIQAEQLESHLELLAQSGLHALSPDKLAGFEPPSQGAYILSFDDGTVDHYEVVLPLLARHKCCAVFFVPSAKLDRPGYLTSNRVTEMSRAGQTIGLHSHDHRRLDELEEEEVRGQMQLSRQIIGNLTGKRPDFFAPPGGYINRRVRDIALESGVRVIRTMRWGYNQKPDFAALECVPVNRHLTERKFRQVLEFRRGSAMLYATKQIAKRMLPGRTYNSLRDIVFRHSAGR